MRLNFEKTQENGDATCNYIVTWSELGATVDDICDAVLAHSMQANERGDIYISTSTNCWHAQVCEYQTSVMEFHDAYFDYKDRKVHRIWANGGWGAMSYYLTLE